MKTDQSFGVIPLKKIDGEWYVLLIKHQKSSFWGFPKGHADEGESSYETALRELVEETGLTVRKLLVEQPLSEKYRFRANGLLIEKTVYYFVAEVNEGDVILQNEEIEDSNWIALNEAENYVTFDQAKHLCKEVIRFL